VLLGLLAEAAWTSIVAGLVQALGAREPSPGIPAMFAAAFAGMVAARYLGLRLGARWPWLAGIATLGAGVAACLAVPEARAVLASRGIEGLGAALASHPGGWLAAVAFLRGIAYGGLLPDPVAAGRLLGLGVPGLALTAMAGGMAAEPWRGRFLDTAQGEVVVFLVAAILALALSRLAVVDGRPGVDWRRNPAWVALLVVLLLAVAAAAVSISLVAGPAIVALIGASMPLLAVLGLLVGFDRRSLRVLLTSLGMMTVLAIVISLVGARPASPAENTGTPIADVLGVDVPTPVAVAALVVLVLIAVIVVAALVRLWMARLAAHGDDLLETRWIDHGDVPGGPPRGRRRRRWLGRPAPSDAVAAYRALLEDLASRPLVRREPGETPHEHAARLRRDGTGELALDLLAADYGLARFGGVGLSAVEERRAIRRAGRLRHTLTGAGGGSSPGRSSSPGPGNAAPPPDRARPAARDGAHGA
jgi:hypothetical protein